MRDKIKSYFGGVVNHTKERFTRLARAVKRILLAVKLLTLVLYGVYLVYEIVTGAFIVFKSILLALTVGYAIFYIIKHDKIDKPSRAAKKISRRLYAVSKIFINGCTLALTIFGLFAATVTTTFWSVTLAVFMLIGWVASLFFEILYLIVERQAEKIARTVKAEAEAVSGKIKSVKERGAARLAAVKQRRLGTAKNDGEVTAADGVTVTDSEEADAPA